MRLKHYSLRTERSYCDWIERFIRFHAMRHPQEMGEAEVSAFLTHLAREGQVVIRPMMYVALSYDHRLVDGAQAVSFLVRVKDLLEDPARMALEA